MPKLSEDLKAGYSSCSLLARSLDSTRQLLWHHAAVIGAIRSPPATRENEKNDENNFIL